VTLPNRTREVIDALASGGVDTPRAAAAAKIEEIICQGDGGKYSANPYWRALA
jgi:hypothetical protein